MGLVSIRSSNIVRISIVAATIILFALLIKRDYFIESLEVRQADLIQRSNQESYLGVYFSGERIGFVRNKFVQNKEDQIALSQEALLVLNVLGEQHRISMKGDANLNGAYLLQNFTFHLEAPFYTMDASGEVKGKEVHLQISTGKELVRDVIALQKPPFISTNRRAYLLKPPLKEGRKIKVPYFDPITLSGQNTVVEYKGREKVVIDGRVSSLHHFIETFSGVRVKSWLNDQGDLIKEESPAGFVFLAEPEFKATNISYQSNEILSAVSVPVQGEMPELSQVSKIRFRLTLPDDGDFTLNKDRQTFQGDILEVNREVMPGDTAGKCLIQEDLDSTIYVQSDSKAITELVSSLNIDKFSPLKQISTISSWVFQNLEKRPVLGIPDALSTLESRRGDCNEHAALFAAMARNIGVPTRIAVGVTYHQGAFYYHAWNEVCIGDSWLSVDTTKDQIPADLSHLKFVEGEVAEQVKIGALLGRLKVEVLPPVDQSSKDQ